MSSDLELRTQAVHVWGRCALGNVRDAVSGAESLQRALGIYRELQSVSSDVSDALDLLDRALPALRRAERAVARIVDKRMREELERDPEPPPTHLWPCGCLINEAGAHRVGCPEHPEGVRGDR